MIHRINVWCEILTGLRIDARSPHALLPFQVDTPQSRCIFFSSLSIPSNPLSFVGTSSCSVFCIFWGLPTGLTTTHAASISIYFLCCWQNPEFPQASGPAAGGNVWLVQTVIIYPGCSLKTPEEFFKQCWHLGYTPRRSDLIGLEWVLKTPMWLKCASKIEVCCSKDPLEI